MRVDVCGPVRCNVVGDPTRHAARATTPLAFREMGVYRLLSLLVGQPELSRFYYETLGELTDDTPQNQEFIATLDAFFEEHVGWIPWPDAGDR